MRYLLAFLYIINVSRRIFIKNTPVLRQACFLCPVKKGYLSAASAVVGIGLPSSW